ncbi:xanthine dehydrogenase family protein molybdopterin-binding subunit [Sulfuriflexus mobilis]|uniref:xanthine dehydrogenase family protein molybdopterin-binding subunit n=1 Tax=Sulfuriflexus mobilis TaxID=1811807 RepID=UPI000F81F36B|nr:xanthine dehydrogenase family protein molybdopterin-binding subunit [Sulfuriflexus mobilis]
MKQIKLKRREFLKISAATGGGLLIGFSLGGCDEKPAPPKTMPMAETETAPTAFTPNAWLTVHSDNRVTIRVGSSEMGQGTLTGIAMLIADELDADWSRVRAEHAPADKAYTNPILGRQHTGGSTAIRGFWTIARKAGATGRELLLQAAAATWAVDVSECQARNGEVLHEASGRRLHYGELARAAAELPLPDAVLLKEPDEFVLIGQPLPRLDTPDKVNGAAVFGMDVQLPNLLIATVARCPVQGGRVKSFDAHQALAVPGVKQVAQISGGVAVIAEHFWAAKKGRDALRIEWDKAGNDTLDSAAIEAQFKAAVDKGLVERDDGDVKAALAAAARTVEAVYTVPFQAHVCMEPMNATADVRVDACDVYAPTQGQTFTQETAMRITGLARDKVKVITTFLGGGFGRRSEQDFIVDAVECSKLAGQPVKVIWTREDDVMHDQYRPATYNVLRGGVDAQGKIVAWEHRIAGPSILARVFPDSAADGHDWSSTEGAKNIPYHVNNLRVTYAMSNTPVPVGFWRSVGSSQNAFITECFFDELCKLAGQDPLAARLALMTEHPRHAGVVKLAAEKAGWGTALPAGHARGIAVAEAFASFVAQVAEVSIDRGRVRVHRITCAVDCGMNVNPNSIRAQMEGGIVYGLTAALKGAITISGGRVQQSNFDDYPLLRLDECPAIEVHIVSSEEAPGGVGEPGVPPTAPAVANAVFALTGQPVRSLPITLHS